MTSDDPLVLYHPIRASVGRILSAAVPVCNQSDLMRAACIQIVVSPERVSRPLYTMRSTPLRFAASIPTVLYHLIYYQK